MIWTRTSSEPIFDDLVVTLIIPTGRAGNKEDEIICRIKYEDFIKVIDKNNINIKINKVEVPISKAIEMNMLKFSYKEIKGIYINDEFEISRSDYVSNNTIGERILWEEISNHNSFSYLKK